MKTIVGLYDDFIDAQAAVRELVNAGIEREQISLVTNDRDDSIQQTMAEDSGATAGGAITGAVVGGLGGILLSLGALAIPGIGPVIAAGPLLAGLVGAGVGAAVGGLVGALVDAGIPVEEANHYAEGVRRGGTLVTVTTSEQRMDEVVGILDQFSPVDVQERATTWRQEGWQGMPQELVQQETAPPVEPVHTSPMNPIAAGYVAETSRLDDEAGGNSLYDFSLYDNNFRRDFDLNYANTGLTYGQYQPAYRYGFTLASDQRFRYLPWNEVEADAQADWSKAHPQQPWEEFKAAIQRGFDEARTAIAIEA